MFKNHQYLFIEIKNNMKKLLYIIAAVLLMASCQEESLSSGFTSEKYLFVEQRNGFLFCKEQNPVVYDTIYFNFKYITDSTTANPIRLGLVNIDDEILTDIVLTVNGEQQKDGTFLVSPLDSVAILEIQFTGVKEHDVVCDWFVKVIEQGCVQRVKWEGGGDADAQSHPKVMAMKASVNVVVNPLKAGLFTSLSVLIAILIVWIILVHLFINPSANISQVCINYPDGNQKWVRAKGACKIVCTPETRKCSLFHKIFFGKIVYETCSFWTNDFKISRIGGVLLLSGAGYSVKPSYPKERIMNSEIVVKNINSGEVITLTAN